MNGRIFAKEQDTGPRRGDRQPAHEDGRAGQGTRPSGTDGKGTPPGGKGKGSKKK